MLVNAPSSSAIHIRRKDTSKMLATAGSRESVQPRTSVTAVIKTQKSSSAVLQK